MANCFIIRGIDETDSALSSTSTNPVQNKVINSALGNKQATLVSGTNIKTINNQSILGEGNITIDGGDSKENQLVAGTGVALDRTTTSGKTIIAFDPTSYLKGYTNNFTLDSGATSITINHNLGSYDVMVQVYNVADGTSVLLDSTRVDTNNVQLNFNEISTDTYRVLIWPINIYSGNTLPTNLAVNDNLTSSAINGEY